MLILHLRAIKQLQKKRAHQVALNLNFQHHSAVFNAQIENVLLMKTHLVRQISMR